ncbi:hypothetical protein DFP72DRAFT_443667 [Ephemerocybe angulata]|uniref:Secreted protein n=1 Tax=Ephemerocybe angulata TaxID=980116 RepID=A0A8H6HV64_9AGAR|nr:hypothetical protein DFP72DRAFT_443667 [Tulosesus angulatus]
MRGALLVCGLGICAVGRLNGVRNHWCSLGPLAHLCHQLGRGRLYTRDCETVYKIEAQRIRNAIVSEVRRLKFAS